MHHPWVPGLEESHGEFSAAHSPSNRHTLPSPGGQSRWGKKREVNARRSGAPSSSPCQGDLLACRLQGPQPCTRLIPWAPALPALAGSCARAAAPCWGQGSILGILITQEQKLQREPIPLCIWIGCKQSKFLESSSWLVFQAAISRQRQLLYQLGEDTFMINETHYIQIYDSCQYTI